MSAQQFYNNEPAQTDRGYNGNGYQGGQQQQQYPPQQQQYAPPPGPPQNYQPQHHQQQQQQYAPPPGPPQNYSMKPSQPYSNQGNPEAGGTQGYTDTAPFSQADEKTGQRLNPRKRLNDPIFLVLYIATLIGFAVISGITIKTFVELNGLGGGVGGATQGGTGTAITLDYHTVYLLLMVCGLGLVIAALYLALVRAFTKIIMEITLALTVLLNIGICIYYFYIKYYSGAIIFLVIALISIFFYWSMRKRIPLARLLFQITLDITKHHPSVYVVVLLGLILQTLVSIWYSFTCIAIYVKYTPGSASCATTSCSSGKVAGLIFYSTFAYLWTGQIIANVVLCTLAGGIFGGWYYYGPRLPQGTGIPKRATLKAFTRASTLSLGSIAFGSLIVTILELLRMILNAVSQYEGSQGDMVGQIVACCAACCVGCIESAVAWFNKYAYIEIALYGKSYIPAAKDTWRLMKDRGIDALINDNLTGITLMFGSYINGFLCGVFGYFYLRFTNPSYNSAGQYSAPIILYSFLIGLNENAAIASAIDAGVSTIFVGLGEDPMVLADRSPALFEEIRQNYPRVIQGVPHNQ